MTETGIGLTTASGGFIEEGPVNLGNNDFVSMPEIVRGVGAKGKCVEFRLGKFTDVYVSHRFQLWATIRCNCRHFR